MPTNETTPTNALPYAVGLDVHQKTISVAVLDPGGQLVERRTIRTCPKMLDELHRDLAKLAGTTRVRLGLEASTAGKACFQHRRTLGRDVRMAHPKKLKALLGDTKTDDIGLPHSAAPIRRPASLETHAVASGSRPRFSAPQGQRRLTWVS